MVDVKAKVFISAGTGISPGHHRYFESSQSALGFFQGKQTGSWDNLLVIRNSPSKHGYNSGCVHVPATLAELENAEYVSYYNSNLSTVWFHNRITSIEYVNSNSSRVYFQCDYYATYIGDCKLGYAFLERGHIPKEEDKVGRFLMREDISVGREREKIDWSDWEGLRDRYKADTYVIFSSADKQENTNVSEVKLQNIGGVPFYGVITKAKDASGVESFIKSYTNQMSSFQTMLKPMMSNIIAIKWMPENLTNAGAATTPVPFITKEFVVKNKKCLHPQFYNYEVFALSSGQSLYFDITWQTMGGESENAYSFNVRACGGINATVGLYLQKSSGNTGMLSNWIAQLPYPDISVNSYDKPELTSYGYWSRRMQENTGTGFQKIWQAGATGAFLGGAAGSFFGGIGAGPGAIVGAATGVASSLLSENKQGIVETNNQGDLAQSYTTAGVASSDYANALNLYTFEIVRTQPTKESLAILEGYFDRWGYSVYENRQVNLKVRENFTYIKTIDANVIGNCPAVATRAINDLLNSGVTIWNVEIGSTKDCG